MGAAAVRRARRIWTETHEPRGRAQRILGSIYPTGVFWFRLVNVLARWAPRFVVEIMIHALALLAWMLARRIRSAVTQNLRVVLGPAGLLERERRILRTFREFSRCMFDRYELFHSRERLRVTFEGEEHWQRLMESGRGFLFISAHYGNWEVGSLMPGTVERAIHVVREPAVDPRSQALMEKLFAQHASETFHVHFAGADATLGSKLLFALRRGEIVGLAGDQPRDGMAYVEAEMFGRPTPLPHGPAALARAAEVPIVPVFALRTGSLEYRVIVRRPIEVERTDDRERDVLTATQAIAAAIEWAIRTSPQSWYCWWPRWSKS